MTAWDQARAAQHRPLRKPYKPVGPVGEHLDTLSCVLTARPLLPNSEAACCKGCGFHVCSCARRRDEWSTAVMWEGESWKLQAHPYVKKGERRYVPAGYVGMTKQENTCFVSVQDFPHLAERQKPEPREYTWPERIDQERIEQHVNDQVAAHMQAQRISVETCVGPLEILVDPRAFPDRGAFSEAMDAKVEWLRRSAEQFRMTPARTVSEWLALSPQKAKDDE